MIGRQQHWVAEPDEYLEPKIGKVGFSARAPKTVIQVFQDTLRKHKHRHALAVKLPYHVNYMMECRM